MSLLMDISMYSAGLSAILLAGLIITYVRMYRDTRAQFSLGLTIFALILLVQNLLAVYSFITMSDLFAEPLPAYLLGINIAELVGIGVLFKTTIRGS